MRTCIRKNINSVYNFLAAIINIFKTPWGYKFDYFLSISCPRLLMKKPLPWINYLAIAHIKLIDKKNTKVFEYGSGSSTLYWYGEGCEIVSIEHDREFYNQLICQLNSQKKSIKYLLIEPESNENLETFDPRLPDLFQSTDFKGHSFKNYVISIDAFEDEYFDIVVVDGRARPACIKRSISKIKKGGQLIIDNSDREYYFSYTSEMLSHWQKHVFRGTVRGLLHQEQTSVYIKPI